MSSRDLATVVKTQKAFIKELLDRLEGKICEGEDNRFISFGDKRGLIPIAYIKELFDDPYFLGLDINQIFELAKKSIRLTDDNCKMRYKLEDIEEIVNAIYDYQVECKDKTNKEFLDKQLQKISDKLLDK